MQARHVVAALLTVAIIAITVVVFTSRSGSDRTATTATVAAKPAYCADVTALQSSITAFKDLQLNLSVITELQANFTRLQDAFNALRTSAGEAFQPQVDAVTTALQKIQTDLTALKDPTEIPSTLLALAGDVDAVTTAVRTLVTEAEDGCR